MQHWRMWRCCTGLAATAARSDETCSQKAHTIKETETMKRVQARPSSVCFSVDAQPRRCFLYEQPKQKAMAVRPLRPVRIVSALLLSASPAALQRAFTTNLGTWPVNGTWFCCGPGLELQVHGQTDRQTEDVQTLNRRTNQHTPTLCRTWYGPKRTTIQGSLKWGGDRGEQGGPNEPPGGNTAERCEHCAQHTKLSVCH